jgi:hypothetical protein
MAATTAATDANILIAIDLRSSRTRQVDNLAHPSTRGLEVDQQRFPDRDANARSRPLRRPRAWFREPGYVVGQVIVN